MSLSQKIWIAFTAFTVGFYTHVWSSHSHTPASQFGQDTPASQFGQGTRKVDNIRRWAQQAEHTKELAMKNPERLPKALPSAVNKLNEILEEDDDSGFSQDVPF